MSRVATVSGGEAHQGELTRAPGEGRARFAAIGATICAAVAGLLIIVPWQPELASSGLDPSWTWALSDAATHGRLFGKEFAFTYGPLGFLFSRRFFAETGTFLWIGWGAFALGWSILLWRHLRRTVASLLGRVLVFGLVLTFGSLNADAFFLSLPILAASIVAVPSAKDDDDRFLDSLAACMLLAAASLVKFTFFMGAVGTVGLLTVRDIKRFGWPASAAAFLSCLVLLWVAIRQPITGLPSYVSTAWEVARGYGAAMSSDLNDRRVVYAVALTVPMFLVASATLAVRRRDLGVGVLTGVLLGTFLLVFKAAFVRLDYAHEIIAPLWALCAMAIAWPSLLARGMSRLSLGLAVVSGIACVATTAIALPRARMPGLVTTALGIPGRVLRSAVIAIHARGALHHERARFSDISARISASHVVPEMAGTVDVYPDELSVIFARGLPYAPRPVLQSYSAYTPALASLNAAHLRTADAPQNILFDVAALDDRLPSMDDGLSWIDIWQRYNVVADTGGFLWLRRRQIPVELPEPREILSAQARFDAPVAVPVPPCDGVMMQVFAKPKMFYRLKTLLWKAPTLTIELSDDHRLFRLLPELLRSGFFLSPMIETRQQFAEFMLKGPEAALDARRPRSVRLRVTARDPERYFAPEFTVRFFAVRSPAPACG